MDSRTHTQNFAGHWPRLLVIGLTFLLAATAGFANETITFDTNATFEPSPTRLKGQVTVVLRSPTPLYSIIVTAKTSRTTHILGSYASWTPNTSRTFNIDLPSTHTLPGHYHLLLQIEHADPASRKQHAPIALEYYVGGANQLSQTDNSPTVRISEHTISWEKISPQIRDVQLDLTTGPYWQDTLIYTPNETALTLRPKDNFTATPNTGFQQLARISWSQNGMHHSKIEPWTLITDADGRGHASSAHLAGGPLGGSQTTIATASYFSIIALALTVLVGGLRFTRTQQPELTTRSHHALSIATVVALTFWLAHNTHPELWFTPTWSTGGDVASHMYYAKVFTEWFWQGKISGWLPESFAGFPAFTYYFPFPFALTALLSVPLNLQTAFKIIGVAPAILLPAATYAMVALVNWPLAARLFAALGATAFLFTTETTFWGGNALATFTGEFAYGWGMLAAAFTLGLTFRALEKGGRWWILAALAEATTALCHGYPILVVGFASFSVLLASSKPGNALRMLLQIHTLAFLLIGAWMLPLIENLPWALSNDTTLWIEDAALLWPRELWPFTIGLIALAVLARKLPAQLRNYSALAGFALIALIGFSIADRIGLAAARFYPLLQWALCVILAGAIGLALERWNNRPLLWALTASFAVAWWCAPGVKQVSEWAEWNLSGYETKPVWLAFREVTDNLRGPLDAPRILFEHDPANVDIGSTRGMEALPLFGTRPALEGLYMESALTGPFIYQAQGEISAQPSSPLSHFVAVPTNIDQALAHMKELYADTLLLRSESMKKKFRDDPRLTVVAEIEPFLILKIKDFSQQLVEPITVPLNVHDRTDWLEDAFKRFRLDHPYQTRRVYLGQGETAPSEQAAPATAHARIIEFERERLVFETDAVGQPHLIRMTYHPRWRSVTGEPILLTEPSFMLVIPQQKRVELVYGDTLANTLGRSLALLGIVVLLIGVFKPRWTTLAPQPPQAHPRARLHWIVAAALIGGACATAWWMTPDREYIAGHKHLAQQDYLGAAALFERAEEKRHYRAAKAEALFWAARSYDMGNYQNQSVQAYTKFRSTYPEAYSYPESAFRQIELHIKNSERDDAARIFAELEKNSPGNKWTEKAREALSEKH